jgi:formate dehydrogenase subunit delta
VAEEQLANLIKMLNQIVNNNMHHEDVAQITADHMKRFWALSMKQNIIRYVGSDGQELEPEAKQAVRLLAKEY